MTLADSSELSAAVSNSENEQLGVDAVPEGACLTVRTILTLRSACRSPDQSPSGPPFACHTSPQRVSLPPSAVLGCHRPSSPMVQLPV